MKQLQEYKLQAILKNFEISLPPLEQQHKTAKTLEKVSDLIDKRKQQPEKLNLLVKSKFVEMFVHIEKLNINWRSEKFKNITVCFDLSNKSIEDSDRKFMQDKYLYYGITGIFDYINDYNIEVKYIEKT